MPVWNANSINSSILEVAGVLEQAEVEEAPLVGRQPELEIPVGRRA